MSKLSKYNFVFNIGQRVKIRELDINGRISAIFIKIDEITYRVRYFFNAEPKEVYFNDTELEPIEEEGGSVGFKVKC